MVSPTLLFQSYAYVIAGLSLHLRMEHPCMLEGLKADQYYAMQLFLLTIAIQRKREL